MKKFLAIMLGVVFIVVGICGCASLSIKPQEQPTFTFPLIGDIDFGYLHPKRFVSREMINPDKMATVSRYPKKSIKFVRIISNRFFQIDNIQYLKDGELFVYRYIREESGPGKGYIYRRAIDLTKEEIAKITKKLMLPRIKAQKV